MAREDPFESLPSAEGSDDAVAVSAGDAPLDAARRTFERFLRDQRAQLLKFLLRKTNTRDDAEDVAQESLTRLLKYRSEPQRMWRPLLYRIARNVAIDQRRHDHAIRRSDHEAFDLARHDLASPDPSPEQAAAARDLLARIREAILELPPRCREVYVLNRFDGMTFVHIAAHLRISSRAVEKHMAKAIQRIRDRVGTDPSGSM